MESAVGTLAANNYIKVAKQDNHLNYNRKKVNM